MKLTRRTTTFALLALSLSAPWGTAAADLAANYPSKPITLVVPYPPGGTNDNVARLLADKVSQRAGPPIIIEYKAGAGGTIGAQFVAKAKPDGYTLLNASIGNLAIAPQLMPVAFDPFTSFQSIAHVGYGITTFAVHPDFPANNLQELVAYAQKHPLSLGTSGVGTPGHMAGEFFQKISGITLQHVPYKGSAAAVNDAIGGHVDLVIDPLSTTFVRSGKLKALAYFGSSSVPEGLPPQLQPVAAQGFPQWDSTFGGSFLWTAPAGLPEGIRTKLTGWVLDALAEPEVQTALQKVQVHAGPADAEGTTRIVRNVHTIARDIFITPATTAQATSPTSATR